MSSIVLGSLYHGDHLARAVYGRLGGVDDLPDGFRVHRPLLSGVSNPEARQPGKAPSYAVSWGFGDERLEVLNTTRGRTDGAAPSAVCKYAMMCNFDALWGKLGRLSDGHYDSEDAKPAMYADLKGLVPSYQQAKHRFIDKLTKSGLGTWIRKPYEEDHFTMLDAQHILESASIQVVTPADTSIDSGEGGESGQPLTTTDTSTDDRDTSYTDGD